MDPDATLLRILNLAQFIQGGNAGDMLEEAGEELAQQVLDLNQWLERQGFLPKPWRARTRELESACRGLLRNVGEAIDRKGVAWWDANVTAGRHHRYVAEHALRPY